MESFIIAAALIGLGSFLLGSHRWLVKGHRSTDSNGYGLPQASADKTSWLNSWALPALNVSSLLLSLAGKRLFLDVESYYLLVIVLLLGVNGIKPTNSSSNRGLSYAKRYTPIVLFSGITAFALFDTTHRFGRSYLQVAFVTLIWAVQSAAQYYAASEDIRAQAGAPKRRWIASYAKVLLVVGIAILPCVLLARPQMPILWSLGVPVVPLDLSFGPGRAAIITILSQVSLGGVALFGLEILSAPDLAVATYAVYKASQIYFYGASTEDGSSALSVAALVAILVYLVTHPLLESLTNNSKKAEGSGQYEQLNGSESPKISKYNPLYLIMVMVTIFSLWELLVSRNVLKADTRGNVKWIVVTTINYPTSTMDHLCALPDWEVAVVADLKTPSDWKAGACHFISVEDQGRMPFQLSAMLPFRAYTRKNLGYLYAMANGAEQIFDTDDDNLPTEGISMQEFNDDSILVGFQPDLKTRKTLNPYMHFGRGDIWPRGYPLERFNQSEEINYLAKGNLPKEMNGRPLVQQGLADLDPDVDAIFRLLNPEDIAQVKFCKGCPTLKLSRGIMAPFNSQNTLWHADAFWGLLLPITVTFRATDIIRGYWAQRLLWDVDGTLSFRPPSVDQIRNPHDYLEDFISERQLYTQSAKLVDLLQAWTSPNLAIQDRIKDLFGAMLKAKFIQQKDVDLVKAWLSDLSVIGYKFPETQPWQLDLAANEASSVGTGNQAASFAVQWQQTVEHPSRPIFDSTLLVITFDGSAKSSGSLDDILSFYKPYFPHILIYGTQKKGHQDARIRPLESVDATAGSRALEQAFRDSPDHAGYLLISSQTAINPYAIRHLDTSNYWRSSSFDWPRRHASEVKTSVRSGEWPGFDPKLGNIDRYSAAMTTIAASLNDKFDPNNFDIYASFDGFWYVPRRLVPAWSQLLPMFNGHSVPDSIVFSTILHQTSTEDLRTEMADNQVGWLKGADPGVLNWFKPGTYLIHPFDVSQKSALEGWKQWYLTSSRA